MIPTRRLLGLLLLGTVVIAGASVYQPLTWLALLFFAVLLGLVIADVIMTPRPDQLEVRRLHESKLSLGVDNLIVLALTNQSQRALSLTVRDEYPDAFPSEHLIATTKLAADASGELRYHVRPLQARRLRVRRYQRALPLAVRHVSAPGGLSDCRPGARLP